MKSFIVALCVFAVAAATSVDQASQVLRQTFEENLPQGTFQYGFETDNGISAQASGVVKSLGKDENALEVSGSNQYKSPEGDTYSLTYVANENGYQPQGAHLPTPPPPQPIPDYILRSIEYNAAHPYVEKKL